MVVVNWLSIKEKERKRKEGRGWNGRGWKDETSKEIYDSEALKNREAV